MGFKKFSSSGVVINSRKYSEADRIITLYSKDYGKLVLMAKGIRKLKSRKRGIVELFSHIKFSASKGKVMDVFDEAYLLNSHLGLKRNLNKLSLAFFMVEVIDKIAQEGEKNNELYELILNYLERIQKEKKLKLLRHDFIGDLVVTLGYWPKNKKILDSDLLLESIIEKKMNSKRVGLKILEGF